MGHSAREMNKKQTSKKTEAETNSLKGWKRGAAGKCQRKAAAEGDVWPINKGERGEGEVGDQE